MTQYRAAACHHLLLRNKGLNTTKRDRYEIQAHPFHHHSLRVAVNAGDAITKRNRTANEATTSFSADTVQNRETAADRIVHSAEKYQSEMKVAIDQQAGAQIAGVNAGAGQAIGGYERGAAQARGGVDQNYQLEVGANRVVYASQVNAAGEIRTAGLEAAKLRQAAAVIAAVGREISREVGQGMRIRF